MSTSLELLREIRRQKGILPSPAPPEPSELADRDPSAGEILEERREPVAWRLYSRLADRELWLARDDRTRAEIEAEYPGVPVVTLAEIPALRRKPPELLAAILATKGELTGARVLQ